MTILFLPTLSGKTTLIMVELERRQTRIAWTISITFHLPGWEKIHRMKPQINKRTGIKWMAFSADDWFCNIEVSFLLATELEISSYIGKSSEAVDFDDGVRMEAGEKLTTENSSEAREVLDDLCILGEH